MSGDPALDVPLTPAGEEAARRLARQLANAPLDACIHTRFSRTRATAELVLAGRSVTLETEPLLDDIDVGDLEGSTLDEYRAWKAQHTRQTPFPGGESLDDAARRYALALRRLLASGHSTMLVVCHEIPIRYAVNAAAGSDHLDGPVHDIPNATPFIFTEDTLDQAAKRVLELVPGG